VANDTARRATRPAVMSGNFELRWLTAFSSAIR
jgi:hypothetical protein